MHHLDLKGLTEKVERKKQTRKRKKAKNKRRKLRHQMRLHPPNISKPSDFRCPDPKADSQDQQSRSPGHPKGVHGVRTASSQLSNTETKAADQAETEDEMSIRGRKFLVNEVERIFAIKERKHKFDWIAILGLESRDMDRRKRALLLIVHPGKSAKFAKHAGEERLKTAYDFVDVAYSDAKKWLDQKNNGKGFLFLLSLRLVLALRHGPMVPMMLVFRHIHRPHPRQCQQHQQHPEQRHQLRQGRRHLHRLHAEVITRDRCTTRKPTNQRI